MSKGRPDGSRNGSNKLNPETLKIVISLLQSGLTQAEIAKLFKVSSSLVSLWVNENAVLKQVVLDIKAAKRATRRALEERVLEEYKRGEDQRKIAENNNTTYSVVRKIIHDLTTSLERKAVQARRKEASRAFKISLAKAWLKPGATYGSVCAAMSVNKSTLHDAIHSKVLPKNLQDDVKTKLGLGHRPPRKKTQSLAKERGPKPVKMELPDLKSYKVLKADSRDQHSVAQTLLALLGIQLDSDVWVPVRDRKQVLALCPGLPLLKKWPWENPQPAAGRGQEIDVVWFQGGTGNVLYAFEIEHTTDIRGGMGRIRDMMQGTPNVMIKAVIVAPGKRLGAFEKRRAESAPQQFAYFLSYERLDSMRKHYDILSLLRECEDEGMCA